MLLDSTVTKVIMPTLAFTYLPFFLLIEFLVINIVLAVLLPSCKFRHLIPVYLNMLWPFLTHAWPALDMVKEKLMFHSFLTLNASYMCKHQCLAHVCLVLGFCILE